MKSQGSGILQAKRRKGGSFWTEGPTCAWRKNGEAQLSGSEGCEERGGESSAWKDWQDPDRKEPRVLQGQTDSCGLCPPGQGLHREEQGALFCLTFCPQPRLHSLGICPVLSPSWCQRGGNSGAGEAEVPRAGAANSSQHKSGQKGE